MASSRAANAAQKHTEANQYRLADLSVFENFIDASLTGDTELADFCSPSSQVKRGAATTPGAASRYASRGLERHPSPDR